MLSSTLIHSMCCPTTAVLESRCVFMCLCLSIGKFPQITWSFARSICLPGCRLCVRAIFGTYTHTFSCSHSVNTNHRRYVNSTNVAVCHPLTEERSFEILSHLSSLYVSVPFLPFFCSCSALFHNILLLQNISLANQSMVIFMFQLS